MRSSKTQGFVAAIRANPCVNTGKAHAVGEREARMLTLADARHLTDVTVFRDVSWAGGARALTPTFYLLSDAPALATSDDGGPAYAFYWYRGTAPPDGGLAVPPAGVPGC